MDFGEHTIRPGGLRKTGKDYTKEVGQPPIYEYRLTCDERFESLPHRPEFADAMEEFSQARKISYSQETPVALEPGDVPNELSDAFYFPDTSVIEIMNLEINIDQDDRQFVEGSFQVGSTEFIIAPGFPGVVFSTESSEGGDLRYKTHEKTLLQLLSIMYTRKAAQMLEQLHKAAQRLNAKDPSFLEVPFSKPTDRDMQAVVDDLVGEGDYEAAAEILEKLASAVDSGKTTFTTHSLFPPQNGVDKDRAILATKTETYHNAIEEQEVNLNINWLLMNTNTELSGTTVHTSSESDNHITPSVTVAPTEYDIESFALMKELDAIAGTTNDGKEFSRNNPEWLSLVSIFMTSIQPFLDRHASSYDY